ncbi:MAG TPA: hypothetical protein PLX89_15820 [Verrucomicrobiota bacterium]|nr:hypothetical protein [Verrucomicrobiales bacterium]HRI14463.1 hypothetical protein [Verrucomicrobiota bacterium]
MKPNRIAATLAGVITLALAPTASAQNLVTWSGGDGDFYLPGNWDTGTVPGLTDIAVINNGGTATISAAAGERDLGAIRLGATEGSTESGHVIMNGGTWKLGYTEGDPKAVIGFSTTLSTFIMNGGTILFDGPDLFPGSKTDDGLNGLDWEVGEKGLGRFEVHNDAVFRAGDDIKVGANAAGQGTVLIDGNAKVSVGSGISVSEGGPNPIEQVMIVAGNALVESGNSMGAGNPLGSTDEGYLTMASGVDSTGRLVVQDNAVVNYRRLSARQGTSIITVKDHGQMHIFDVFAGTGGSPENRPTETGPNSTFVSQDPGNGVLTLQDDAQMTVNSDPESGPTKGLAISGPRDAGNPGGTALMVIRDRASFSVIQDLAVGTGAAETSIGTLEVVGPSAKIAIGGNLSLAVDLDGVATPGRGTLQATLTGPTHSTVVVTNVGRISNGHLKVKLSGFTPRGGETYTLVTAASFDGQFLDADYTEAVLPTGLSWELQYNPTSVVLKVAGVLAGPKTITVNNPSNVAVVGQTNLLQAIGMLEDGDTIQFNIAGAGPHYIQTPDGGYPYIEADNVTIDGYTQPGAVPNSNTILAANNAQIKIILDSRNGNSKIMDFPPDNPNDDTGYGSGESAILGVLTATNVTVRGVGMLAVPLTGGGEVAVYGVAFAKGANGHINGCWIGVDVNGETSFGIAPADGVTGFRYQQRNEENQTTNVILVSDVVIGVAKGSTSPRSEFNVITGVPAIPVILEGQNHRFSGNFFGVLPSGNTDFNVTAIPENAGNFEGFIEVGRSGNNTVIGVDGDGVNDAEERNVFGGTLPENQGGYDHSIEFYGQTPGTNIVVAGNYIGVGVDGVTRFNNSVSPLNAPGGSAQYRFGSDFDGVSDAVEGNVVYNNFPESSVAESVKSFFDELNQTGVASVRGNKLVNNYIPPVDPLRIGMVDGENVVGGFMTNYYSRIVADVNNGLVPVLSSSTTVARLIGSTPLPNAEYPNIVVDLYIPDPEGIATGKALDPVLYPEGWIQGKTYLGSYLVDGPQDLNAAAGAFEFDISGLNIPANTLLTVASTYSKSPAGTHNGIGITTLFSVPVAAGPAASGPTINPVTLNAEGTAITISWTGGVPPYQLQRRTQLNGDWVNEGPADASTTRTVPVSGSEGYFQVVGQ